jgi:hypothetical protein
MLRLRNYGLCTVLIYCHLLIRSLFFDSFQTAASFGNRMETDEQKILFRILDIRSQEQQIDAERNRFVDNLSKVESAVRQRSREMKQLIDEQVNELMAQIRTIRAETLQSFDGCLEKLASATTAMEAFYRESHELKLKSSPWHITRVARELHRRAKKLMGDVTTAKECRAPDVRFTPATTQEAERAFNDGNSVGHLLVGARAQGKISHTSMMLSYHVFLMQYNLSQLDFPLLLLLLLLLMKIVQTVLAVR